MVLCPCDKRETRNGLLPGRQKRWKRAEMTYSASCSFGGRTESIRGWPSASLVARGQVGGVRKPWPVSQGRFQGIQIPGRIRKMPGGQRITRGKISSFPKEQSINEYQKSMPSMVRNGFMRIGSTGRIHGASRPIHMSACPSMVIHQCIHGFQAQRYIPFFGSAAGDGGQ